MSHPSGLLIAIAGMLTLAVAMGIGRFAFTPILPMMQQDTGLSLAAAGWLASANYIGYFLGAASALWIRFSAEKVIRVALIVIAITTAAMGMVENLFAWLILRGLAGVASAWVLIFAATWVLQKLAVYGRPGLSGLLFGGVGLGIVLAGLCCLVFLQISWLADQAWITLGIIALLLTVITWPVYQDGTGLDARKPTASKIPFHLRPYMLLIVCYGIFGFAYIIPATFLPAMAKQIIDDPVLFGWAWPIFGMAAFVSALVAGWVSAKLSHLTIWAVGHGVMAIGILVPVLWPNMTGIVISSLCVGGTMMVITQSALQQARRVAPEHPERLMATMTSVFAIGQILGPMLVSVFGEEEKGLNNLLIFASVTLSVSAVTLLFCDSSKISTLAENDPH